MKTDIFSDKQQALLLMIGDEFGFSAENIKYKQLAFSSDDQTSHADKLVKEAEKFKNGDQSLIIAGYKPYNENNPLQLDGDCLEQYLKWGRSITLTDDAANWLAAQSQPQHKPKTNS